MMTRYLVYDIEKVSWCDCCKHCKICNIFTHFWFRRDSICGKTEQLVGIRKQGLPFLLRAYAKNLLSQTLINNVFHWHGLRFCESKPGPEKIRKRERARRERRRRRFRKKLPDNWLSAVMRFIYMFIPSIEGGGCPRRYSLGAIPIRPGTPSFCSSHNKEEAS